MGLRRPLPLASGHSFAFSRFEEAEALYAKLYYPIHIERPRSEHTFAWRVQHADVGGLGISAFESAGELYASSDNEAASVVLCIPIGSATGATWQNGRRYDLVSERYGAIVQPGVPGCVKQQADYQCINVNVKQQDVDRALTVLTGKEPRTRLRFDSQLALTAPSTRALLRMLHWIIAEVDSAKLAAPVLDRLGEAFTVQLLHAQPHNHSGLLSAGAPAATPVQVRRVAEYLEAELERPVRMSDLTELTGTSARSIQAGFKKHFGCTPLELLRARRLDRARALLACEDERSVEAIARACGLHHPGRFSIYYRERFGETPLQTRAKRSRALRRS